MARGNLSSLPSLLLILISSLMIFSSRAADPDPAQDYCVANVELPLRVNGFTCKPEVTPLDFVSYLLREPPNPTALENNRLGSIVTQVNVQSFPGLHTQGLSIQRFTYAPGGVIPPHVHPRSSELLYVLQGTVVAGFVTTDNRLFQATLEPGDLFIYPRALIHFSVNTGETPALAIASFNSANPGTALLPNALFASVPVLPAAVLAKTFALSQRKRLADRSRFFERWLPKLLSLANVLSRRTIRVIREYLSSSEDVEDDIVHIEVTNNEGALEGTVQVSR
ncbi:germin-like protein 5-1 [Selaginella moellendorffii]|uniref:germin-like protein 5-1 n=1 Tax=Selaginella moellendorffii TaxID=88036 RepID=UPI000D1C80CF|nr:germin-like protein 5-1 [Selaginella moellendorffii]|eukprot:XP_024517438.1 germin-like protein 5-1 [Selaginella moellendorffii]